MNWTKATRKNGTTEYTAHGEFADWTIARVGHYVLHQRGTGALTPFRPGMIPPYLRRRGSFRTLAEAKARAESDEMAARAIVDAAPLCDCLRGRAGRDGLCSACRSACTLIGEAVS